MSVQQVCDSCGKAMTKPNWAVHLYNPSSGPRYLDACSVECQCALLRRELEALNALKEQKR